MCGPDTQPAEDAPVDLDYELPTAGTAATYFDDPPGYLLVSLAGRRLLRLVSTVPGRDAHPAVALNDDGLHYDVPPAAAAETAAAA